jgi:hypothetical protein
MKSGQKKIIARLTGTGYNCQELVKKNKVKDSSLSLPSYDMIAF